MRAIVLAGGKGTRLRPYTATLPKPLVPLGDKPILEYIIIKLKKAGFTHITIAVNHLADLIKAFFGDGSKWGIKIDYSLEDKPLSTIGPLTLIEDLPDNFLVLNGDVLTDLDLKMFMESHINNNAEVTVASYRRIQKVDFGVIEHDETNRINGFREKPEYHFLVSMGIYAISKSVIDRVEKNSFYGFDHMMLDGIKKNSPFFVHEHTGLWLDIGRPDDYENAANIIETLDI